MLKKLLTLSAILLIASCSSKVKENEEISSEVQIEDNSNEVANFQAVESEQDAAAIDMQTQKEIEEVEVQDRVLFGYDSFELSEAAKEILTVQSEWLNSDSSLHVTIEGHCDERGTREYNLALGEKRAESAKSFLVSKGVSSSRIKVISYGKERPAFIGASEDSLAKNRRAVTVVE
jgi:peptidoglycan-associated lipoprotein